MPARRPSRWGPCRLSGAAPHGQGRGSPRATIAGLLLAFLGCVPVPTLASEPEVTAAGIRVVVENGLVSLDARGAPLEAVVREIGAAAGFKTVVSGDLAASVTKSFSQVPVDAALRRVLADGVVMVTVYEAAAAGGHQPGPAEVHLIAPLGGERRTEPPASSTPTEAAPSTGPVARGGLLDVSASDSGLPVSDDGDGLTVPAELSSPAAADRARYVDGLAGLRDPLTVGILADIVAKDPDPEVRRNAVRTLTAVGGARAAAVLESTLGDPDGTVRAEVLRGLVTLSARDATLLLGQALFGDRDPSVREEAVRLLSRQQGEPARVFLRAVGVDAAAPARP